MSVFQYPLHQHSKSIQWFQERATLSPTNKKVDKLNDLILSKFVAQPQIYFSVNTVLKREDAIHFPTIYNCTITVFYTKNTNYTIRFAVSI